MKVVAGIDQSYTGFGYCVDGLSKKKGFPLTKFVHPIERLVYIHEWTTRWLEDEVMPVDLVVMEGYANAAKFGRESAGELGGVVKMAIHDVTSQYPLIVPPTSLKKFVTGKGNAKKNEMLLGVYKRWGVEFGDDNQADAYALEQFGRAYLFIQWGEDAGYPQYQLDAVEAVRKLS